MNTRDFVMDNVFIESAKFQNYMSCVVEKDNVLYLNIYQLPFLPNERPLQTFKIIDMSEYDILSLSIRGPDIIMG